MRGSGPSQAPPSTAAEAWGGRRVRNLAPAGSGPAAPLWGLVDVSVTSLRRGAGRRPLWGLVDASVTSLRRGAGRRPASGGLSTRPVTSLRRGAGRRLSLQNQTQVWIPGPTRRVRPLCHLFSSAPSLRAHIPAQVLVPRRPVTLRPRTVRAVRGGLSGRRRVGPTRGGRRGGGVVGGCGSRCGAPTSGHLRGGGPPSRNTNPARGGSGQSSVRHRVPNLPSSVGGWRGVQCLPSGSARWFARSV